MGEGSLTLPIKHCDWLRGGVTSSLTVSVCSEPKHNLAEIIALYQFVPGMILCYIIYYIIYDNIYMFTFISLASICIYV